MTSQPASPTLEGATPAGEPPDAAANDSRPSGQGSELARLFLEHNRSLHSFLCLRVGSEADAEDIAQEAYARLLQLDRPGAIGYLRAYLFKVAAHIAVDRARQRSLQARFCEGQDPEEPQDTATPDAQVHAAEQLTLLKRALCELPWKYRRAFLLYRFQEWTTRQIAQDLGVRERMARNYVSRALLYCRLRLDGVSPSRARREVMP